MKALAFIVILSLYLGCIHCYLPGVAPRGYDRGEPVPLKVNSLTSSHTQMPYMYYTLAFCQPEIIEDSVENLGEILTGDRIENSPYEILAGEDAKCKLLCNKKLGAKELKLFSERISEEYRVQWLLDNLPAATKKLTIDATGKTATVYESGFALGKKGREAPAGEDGILYINNHVSMKILYNDDEIEKIRIVGFEVEPESILHPYDPNQPNNPPSNCQRSSVDGAQPPQSVSGDQETVIRFTYSIKWEERDTGHLDGIFIY